MAGARGLSLFYAHLFPRYRDENENLLGSILGSSRTRDHCCISTPNGGGICTVLAETPISGNTDEAQPATDQGSGPGYRGRAGRMRTHARAGRSRPRRPGAALGNVPELTGGGGSRLAGVLARPLTAPTLETHAKKKACV